MILDQARAREFEMEMLKRLRELGFDPSILWSEEGELYTVTARRSGLKTSVLVSASDVQCFRSMPLLVNRLAETVIENIRRFERGDLEGERG